ncbi:MAG: PDDEXK nuclease domain-containing protein [Candidatus Pseudobacter hemicellulosilyticus]|uniref:PDDEXK nuclease domain-containing protein n=1 Tax=Candidatus Pseudobacter hemicellulosilyticus TaxID=3121375 RepID=A0AAJ5WS08_9BACT|nr:MAG: PDDEXK nuclease domain-containing protein [Pseudobacter sp.]
MTGISYIQEIKDILAQARKRTYAMVNAAMVEAYWQIGRRIVEEEQQGKERAAYGEAILKELSKALTVDFGRGFSYANLRNFRQFYLTYPDQQICYTVCSKLPWSHNRLIMRIISPDARNYYLQEAAEQNWSVRTLERNIDTFYYQRLLSSKTPTQTPLRDKDRQHPRDFIKDPFVFEFLDIPEPDQASETQIEEALVRNLQQFLLEMGKGFSLVGRQYRISTEGEHYFIDLVFYNYVLRCFVLADLKVGKLTHQDIGQMDMYRRMFDDLKRSPKDSPTIGIVLCTEKSDTVVRYSIINDDKNLFAAKYMSCLPTEAELAAEIEREKRKLQTKRESSL